jgi:serine/threonine-protein kinase HipA
MTNNNEKVILVYADWKGLDFIRPLGRLYVQHVRGKEIFSFEYEDEWIGSAFALYLDPNLGFYKGKQYLPEEKQNFGIFLDSCPDRWGRLLMRRREAAFARKEGRKENNLFESDYLLGVYDGHRMGGLRFRMEEQGAFLNDQREFASPPWTSLRDLEFASLQLEREDVTEDSQYLKWLSMLVDPGSSLGGARPKANVLDEKGRLWIAKFPSRSDTKNTGAWEMVLHRMAVACKITVPETRLLQLTGKNHTYLSRRFDRNIEGQRIHFASAMTLLGHNDGDDFHGGTSYLEMVEFISRFSPESTADLEQLWRRILFNVLVSNTDDHLRNHGFILTPFGWRLSPAYDMNPNESGTGLKLNISENDNALDPDLVMQVAPFFKLSESNANKIRLEMTTMVGRWSEVAKNLGISNQEREIMKAAFRKCGI